MYISRLVYSSWKHTIIIIKHANQSEELWKPATGRKGGNGRQAVIGPLLASGHLSILYTVYTAISDWLASGNR